jgi:hypothetical protein
MIILSTLFSKEIGLKSLGDIGESTFGMSVIKEELILSRDTFSS